MKRKINTYEGKFESMTEINALMKKEYDRGRADEAKNIFTIFSEEGINLFWLGARALFLNKEIET